MEHPVTPAAPSAGRLKFRRLGYLLCLPVCALGLGCSGEPADRLPSDLIDVEEQALSESPETPENSDDDVIVPDSSEASPAGNTGSGCFESTGLTEVSVRWEQYMDGEQRTSLRARILNRSDEAIEVTPALRVGHRAFGSRVSALRTFVIPPHGEVYVSIESSDLPLQSAGVPSEVALDASWTRSSDRRRLTTTSQTLQVTHRPDDGYTSMAVRDTLSQREYERSARRAGRAVKLVGLRERHSGSFQSVPPAELAELSLVEVVEADPKTQKVEVTP